LLHGAYPVSLALTCGFDWCIVNLLNRATDVDEDRLNDIAATELVARHRRLVVGLSLGALVASLVVGAFLFPFPVTALRVVFHVLGLGYSFRIVPTRRGLRRFKDLYVLKNSMSAVMFVLSVVGYPLMGLPGPLAMPTPGIVAVVAFFFVFEHSFEVIYDLRDLPGDRAVGVPTYPVVHGLRQSASLVYALCAVAASILLAARAFHLVTTRELLMVAAPAAQVVFLRHRTPERVSRADCIAITYGGAALLGIFLIGTACWSRAGLPMDI
ncbi:MAG: UbiA family prenyltransferase, partial [Polyangiaceae bacterium]